jgi:hypothetical protein
VCESPVAVLHRWWLCYAGSGCVTLVVVTELPIVSLEQKQTCNGIGKECVCA